jgi:hypothetical protein
MLRVELEPMTPASETVHALDRAITVTGQVDV